MKLYIYTGCNACQLGNLMENCFEIAPSKLGQRPEGNMRRYKLLLII